MLDGALNSWEILSSLVDNISYSTAKETTIVRDDTDSTEMECNRTRIDKHTELSILITPYSNPISYNVSIYSLQC